MWKSDYKYLLGTANLVQGINGIMPVHTKRYTKT